MFDAVVLEGRVVRLEPLTRAHVPELCDVGLDPELWRWTAAHVVTVQDMDAYVDEALALQEAGAALPFAIRERASGRVVGSTRFGAIDRRNRRAEIGWTWVAPAWQRTAVNTEAKYLLLSHAFEHAGCIRVEFKTDVLNTKSRAALLRLGAIEEGILRRHIITTQGRIRDTIYFSILDSEWPAVKARLQEKLSGGSDRSRSEVNGVGANTR